MTFKEQLEAVAGKPNHRLTNEEYDAVYYWLDEIKDSLDYPLKEALIKLVNGEMYRRMD